MKVIKSTNPEHWTAEIFCSYCESLLEITIADLKVDNTGIEGGQKTWKPQVFILCPECNCTTNLVSHPLNRQARPDIGAQYIPHRLRNSVITASSIDYWHAKDVARGLVK